MPKLARAFAGEFAVTRTLAVSKMVGLSKEEGSAQSAPVWMMLCAGALGAFLGLTEAVDQRVVEASLVLAHQIQYPPNQIMAEYYYNSWTLINQIGALFLDLGLDQVTLNYLFASIAPGILVAAYAMAVWGLTKRPLFSVLAGTVCYLTGLLIHPFESPDYGFFVNWTTLKAVPPLGQHTYTIYATVWAAWCLAALLGGRNFLAGISVALLLAIHPVIGLYLIANLIFVMGVSTYLLPKVNTRGIGRGLLVGLICSALSFLIYWHTRVPHLDGFVQRLYEVYTNLWDTHRDILMDRTTAVQMALSTFGVAVICVLLLMKSRGRWGTLDVFIIALLGTALASGTLYFAFHLASDFMPSLLVRVIPSRFPSIQASLAGAVAIGGVVCIFDQLFTRLGGATTVSPPMQRRPIIYWSAAIAPYGLLIFGLYFFYFVGLVPGTPSQYASAIADATSRFFHKTNTSAPSGANEDPFWSAVRHADIKGLVLTQYDATRPALSLGHLPVILDVTAIDFIPYFPDTVGEAAKIIETGYGVRFDNPFVRYAGRVSPPDAPRYYWTQLTPQDWMLMRKALGVVALIAPSGWRITLQPKISGPIFSLYEIPVPQ